MQETGRVGCDGEFATAILYFAKEELSKARHVTDDMISYIKNQDKCNSFTISLISFLDEASGCFPLGCGMPLTLSKLLQTSKVVHKHLATLWTLFSETFAPSPAIAVLHALFKCSICKSVSLSPHWN